MQSSLFIGELILPEIASRSFGHWRRKINPLVLTTFTTRKESLAAHGFRNGVPYSTHLDEAMAAMEPTGAIAEKPLHAGNEIELGCFGNEVTDLFYGCQTMQWT
jgi:hypothetical protein